jgi:ribosomal protein S18 acetylase RimI-like enzyme
MPNSEAPPADTSSVPDRRIEQFDAKRHAREDFSCGVESLDTYLRARARQDREKHAAAIFVLAEASTVIGYYTLSAYTIHPGELPAEVVRKLPRYPNLPATLIGRLAVDSRHQGQGLGERLLMDALKRALGSASQVASLAVVVEAENETAEAWYKSYGFLQFPDHPAKLFLPMKTIQKLF